MHKREKSSKTSSIAVGKNRLDTNRYIGPYFAGNKGTEEKSRVSPLIVENCQHNNEKTLIITLD